MKRLMTPPAFALLLLLPSLLTAGLILDWSDPSEEPSEDEGTALVVRTYGRNETYVFVAGRVSNGSDYDFVILAYDSEDGHVEWTATCDNGGDDQATALALSPDGKRLYVTGMSQDTSGGGDDYDYVTVKYDAFGGDSLDGHRFDSQGGDDLPVDIETVSYTHLRAHET